MGLPPGNPLARARGECWTDSELLRHIEARLRESQIAEVSRWLPKGETPLEVEYLAPPPGLEELREQAEAREREAAYEALMDAEYEKTKARWFSGPTTE